MDENAAKFHLLRCINISEIRTGILGSVLNQVTSTDEWVKATVIEKLYQCEQETYQKMGDCKGVAV